MKATELHRLQAVVDHDLAADASVAVAVVERHAGAETFTELWVTSLDTRQGPARITEGYRDLAPSISPDASCVAFIRVKADCRQLCISELASSQCRVVVESRHGLGLAVSKRLGRGVSPPRWSPDGSWIAYVDVVHDEPPYPGSSAAIIRQLPFQFDGRGYIHDGHAHVHVFGVAEGTVRRLTSDRNDHWDICWRPDGRAICFGVDEVLDEARATVLRELAFDPRTGSGGASTRLTDGRCTVYLPSYSPDGRSIAFLGIGPFAPGAMDVRGRNTSIWRVDPEAPANIARLSDAQPFDIDDRRMRPLVVDERGTVTVTIRSRGAVQLGEMSADGWRPLLAGSHQVTSYARAGAAVTAVIADAESAGELFRVSRGSTSPLTPLRATYADVRRHAMVEVDARNTQGQGVHGWIMRPDSRGPHPLLLLIHGGPDTQWGYALNDEAQAYVSAGYAVLLPNPRGSAGYGEAHARVLNGQVGIVDVEDVLALLDHVLARFDLDERRVGVLGRSYGGFLTAWLAAMHGNRFAAAVGECGIYDWRSVLATSDLGWHLAAMVGESPQSWHDRSPLTFSGNITMPFLVMQYLADLRIPREQGHQMFAALKRHGTPTELVEFQGGPHSFAETGPLPDRVARLHIIIEWFDRWLRAGQSTDHGARPA
jgi:dipeptidyl aminopeptidase/acylaminoacyl peptidase